MIRPVNIGEVIVNSLVFDPKQSSHVRAIDMHELLASVPGLFELLDRRGVDYLLVGGIAMLVYVKGRNTQDIDLMMSSTDLASLPELAVADQNPQFARTSFGPLQVDLLLTDDPFFAHVQATYSAEAKLLDRTIRCVSVDGLLLLKLFALPSLYRQGQFDRVELYERDLTMLIRAYQPDLAKVLGELSTYVSTSDRAEIDSIVHDIRARIAKAEQRFRNE